MEIALKITSGNFNPVQITFLRFLMGSFVLIGPALIGLKKRGCKLSANDFAFFSLTGFICVVVSMMLYQLAILYTPAAIVAVLFSCNPVFVVFFSFIILHEKIYRFTLVSTAISIAGMVVIMNPLKIAASPTGITLTILAAIAFALYSVVSRTRSERYGGIALTCFSFLAGSVELLLFSLIAKTGAAANLLSHSAFKEFANINFLQGITLQTLPGLIYVGIFVTGLGYAFYFIAMEKTSAVTASIVFFIKPALAPLLALAIIGEPITFTLVAGILIIVAGTLVSFIFGSKSKNQMEPKAISRN